MSVGCIALIARNPEMSGLQSAIGLALDDTRPTDEISVFVSI